MARTRSTKGSAPKESTPEPEDLPSTTKSLPTPTTNPPKLFVLPKDASTSSRIVTLSNPANDQSSRYFFCAEKGFHEFTRIAAPKKTPKSWLITSDDAEPHRGPGSTLELGTGYVTKSADMFIATPIDTLFLLLPALAPKNAKQTKQHFLSLDDHLDTLYTASPHLRTLIAHNAGLRISMAKRLSACCDTVDAGDEIMYRLSTVKLLSILIKKAQRMLRVGFPASLEEKFIKPALEVPVMNIKREESSVSIVSETVAVGGDTQESTTTTTTTTVVESHTTTTAETETETELGTQDTTLTTPSETPVDQDPAQSLQTPPEVPALLRLRTALNYLLSAYIPPTLHSPLKTLIVSSNTIDFTPLTTHLAALAALKAEALALRSISDNISRKRGYADDEEKIAEREEKKRKKEEEEKKKKGESRGIKALKKVDTTGMKKLSSFFAAKPKK